MNDFLSLFQQYSSSELVSRIEQSQESQVLRSLSKQALRFEDFVHLLSPVAANHLESLAQKSHALTVQRFGKVIQLYAPLYVSNECYNTCTYCWFTKENKIPRKTLNDQEFLQDFEELSGQGFQNILLLSGEDQREVPIEYFEQKIALIKDRCSYIGLEIYPLDEQGYRRLNQAGAHGVTFYQETYDQKLYAQLHLAGPKRLFEKRLATPDAICASGMRQVGLGALLGLGDWRYEVAMLALHAQYLMKTYWNCKVSISVPRLKEGHDQGTLADPVSDRQLVQILCALRLFLPDVGLVLSTRETAQLRDHLIPLGITQMSAGSKTNPGGYAADQESLKQFEISDERSALNFADVIRQKGYEPVWKDWDEVFCAH